MASESLDVVDQGLILPTSARGSPPSRCDGDPATLPSPSPGVATVLVLPAAALAGGAPRRGDFNFAPGLDFPLDGAVVVLSVLGFSPQDGDAVPLSLLVTSSPTEGASIQLPDDASIDPIEGASLLE